MRLPAHCVTLLQIANTYFFLINGFPQQLWDTLPADLHPTDELLVKLDAAEAARPEGNTTAIAPLARLLVVVRRQI